MHLYYNSNRNKQLYKVDKTQTTEKRTAEETFV